MKTLKSLPFGIPAIAASLLMGAVPSLQAQAQDGSPGMATVSSLASLLGSDTQVPPAAKQPASILDKTVEVAVVNSNLVDALQAIVGSVNGKVSHTEDLKKFSKRVSYAKKGRSLKDAISELLSETGFEAYLVPPGEIVIRRSTGKQAPQDSTSVRITVRDASTNRGLVGATIELAGINRSQVTADNGTALFRNVPAGKYTATIRRIGYSTIRQEIVVEGTEQISIDVSLTVMASSLTEVVTTGAAERAKYEVGTSIATVDVDEIMKTNPVSTVSQLLATRIPGLVATPSSGAVGAPTRIRIRGNTSIEGNNEPIYIVDGIRVSNDVTTSQTNTIYAGVRGGNGENDFSQRIDDIDPHMIESIEVLKGPTASTLYGSEAANGVIIIKTKRGQAGPTRWTVRGDRREFLQGKDYPYGMRQKGYSLSSSSTLNQTCNLQSLVTGTCIPLEGELIGFNMLRNSEFTPVGNGFTQSFGASVNGGVERIRYSLSLNRTDELGNAKLPNVNKKYIEDARGGKKLPKEIVRPNARDVTQASARIDGLLSSNSDFSLQATFGQSYMRAGNQGMAAILRDVREEDNLLPVEYWEDWNGTRSQDVKKIIGAAVVNTRPQWRGIQFNGSGTFGWDFNLNDDMFYIPRGSCVPLCTANDRGLIGYVNAGRKTDHVKSLRLIGGGIASPTDYLRIDMRLGMDYTKVNNWNLYGNAEQLRLGQRFYAAGKVNTIQDIGDARATAGWFYEPTLNIRNRLFFTVGVRGDAGSAMGDEVSPKFPKWNASWIVSEESFFPERLRDFVDVLRFRVAYGKAGIMPTSNARLRTYSMSSGFVNDGDTPGTATGTYAQLTGPGNLWIRPEQTKEYEGGFEIDFLDQRFGLDVTYFRKNTYDAIQGIPLAGSIGAGVTYQSKRNIGHVQNTGFEISTNARIVDNDKLSYYLNGHISRAANKLTKRDPGVLLFSDLNASGDLYSGNQTRVVEGYPLFGRWAYEFLGFEDIDGNGLIDLNEVRVGDTLRYIGSPQPKFSGGLNHSLGLFQNKVFVTAGFSFVYGQTQYNSFIRTYKDNLLDGQGAGSLASQACIAASTANGNRRATDWCFFENTNTLRFQTLGIGYQLPTHLAQRMKAASARVNLNANNIAVWTNYSGRDPNVNSTPVNLNGMEAGSVFAKPREIGFSFSVTF